MKFPATLIIILLILGCDREGEIDFRLKDYHREYSEYSKIRESDNAIVFRHKISDDSIWEAAKLELKKRRGQEGFIAYVDFLNDPTIRNKNWEEVIDLIGSHYNNPAIFFVDEQFESDGTIAIYDLWYDKGDTFRLRPEHIQVIENNITTGNLSFFDFKEEVVNGVYEEPK